MYVSNPFIPYILQSDDDGDDNIKNVNDKEKIFTKKQIINNKDYKKRPLINMKNMKKLKSENILDVNMITNDKDSPVNNKPQSLSELLQNTDIRFLSLLYTFFCFSVMFVDEVFPLWAVRYVLMSNSSRSYCLCGVHSLQLNSRYLLK